jgi:hypothetical protein
VNTTITIGAVRFSPFCRVNTALLPFGNFLGFGGTDEMRPSRTSARKAGAGALKENKKV